MIRKMLAGTGAFILLGIALFMPVTASAAEPLPFATASAPCSAGSISFPAQAAAHPDVVVHFRSLGGEGQLGLPGGTSFGPGDEGWSSYGEVEAGTAPALTIECSSGSVEASLANRPLAPSTFSGITTPDNPTWALPFTAGGAGQYVIDLSISQGALSIEGVPGILQSSGEYSLGSISKGAHEFPLRAESGPTAIWSATVWELPVAINKLAFGQACISPGTGIPATFSVTGDTTITAKVINASEQVVRELGTFGVKEGSGSIPWDGRGGGGSILPNGSYTLSLTSTDPQGDTTSAQTTLYLASSGPNVSMTSPQSITPSQSVAFQVADTGCGVASASVSIDGKAVGSYGKTAGEYAEDGKPVPSNGALVFPPRTPWKPGRHTWKFEATDKAGNTRTASGEFNVKTGTPPQVVCLTKWGEQPEGQYQVRPHSCGLHVRGRYPVAHTNVATTFQLHWVRWGDRFAIANGKLGVSTYGLAPLKLRLTRPRLLCGHWVFTRASWEIRTHFRGHVHRSRSTIKLDACLH